MTDMVQHPPHYGAERFGIECVELTRHLTFLCGNAVKYIWRHQDKANPVQDLDKAAVYAAWCRDHRDPGILPGHERAVIEIMANHFAPRWNRNEALEYVPIGYLTDRLYTYALDEIASVRAGVLSRPIEA